jgi:hypothetical protein
MSIRLLPLALALLVSASCAVGGRAEISQREVADLWQEPTDLERRDLFYGAGGRALAPSATGTYTVVEADVDGFSAGYDVRDEKGRLWSVKLGPESQTEVVASRLLWAVGYHQPAVYYLPKWTLTKEGARSAQSPGRFRLEPAGEEKLGDWSWRNNPFVGTRPYQGLFVMMVMINNWDLKTSQNAIYRVRPRDDDPRNIYVIKDLGASFGKTNWLLPGSRNDIAGFEQEPFIENIEGNRVTFHYQGGWREPHLTSSTTPADVKWIADLLGRLSTRQWSDAFRAGGYSDAEAARFIKRLREKIADGQNVG